MKRYLNAVLIISILLAFLNVSAAEAVQPTGGSCGADGATWSYDAAAKTLTISGTGAITDYAADSYSPWKLISGDIETVKIEDGITAVGNYSFAMCEKLKTVLLGSSVERIGEYAFGWDTVLSKIDFPASLKTIESEAFVWCSLINSVTIPQNVSKIEKDTFLWCIGMKKFDVAAENSSFCADGGVLFTKDKLRLVAYPCALETDSYAVPDGTAIIGENAFAENEVLKNIYLPDSVTEIEKNAFFDCVKLAVVRLPQSISEIGESAFYNCKSIEEISVPASLSEIKKHVFKKCTAVKTVTIPASVSKIDADAFDGVKGFVICGDSGSAAQHFAENCGADFYALTKVYLDGSEIEFDQKPLVMGGSTMVPLRAVFEKLGAAVEWEDSTRTVHAEKDGVKIDIQIDNTTMYKNGAEIKLNMPATLLGGRTLVPLRAVSEAFGVNVTWDDETFSVNLLN